MAEEEIPSALNAAEALIARLREYDKMRDMPEEERGRNHIELVTRFQHDAEYAGLSGLALNALLVNYIARQMGDTCKTVEEFDGALETLDIAWKAMTSMRRSLIQG